MVDGVIIGLGLENSTDLFAIPRGELSMINEKILVFQMIVSPVTVH